MSILWGVFRDQLRRSVLSDVELPPESESANNWSNEQLADSVGWALDAFCSHTALPRTVEYGIHTIKTPGSPPIYYDLSKDHDFELPSDLYEELIVSAALSVHSEDGKYRYLDPVTSTMAMHPYRENLNGYTYWENIFTIHGDFKATDMLMLRYFAYYPRPFADTDVITIPRWAERALAYLTAAYALDSMSVQSAQIDRWKSKLDSGSPEQNALRKQQEWFFKVYELEINKYARQDRVNGFRNEAIWKYQRRT